MGAFFEKRPIIFSTGGGEAGLLQDTIDNFRNAISQGADVLRTNVSVTADGTMVLYSNDVFNHGALSRAELNARGVHELRSQYRDLLRGRAAGGSREDIDGVFPDIRETLEAFPGQLFNFHFPEKNAVIMRVFRETIEKHDAQDRVLVSSVSGFNSGWVRDNMPGVPVAFSFYGMIGFYGLFKSGLIHVTRKFSTQALIIPEMIGASYFANAGLIELAKKRGVRVYVNPVDTEKQARRVKEAGVDGIVTNDIPAVKRVFRD